MNIPGTPSSRAPIPSRPAPVQPGEEIAGKYRVGRVLGAGAMGVVVRAWHIELEQEVALKFLHPELAMKVDGAERFRREARAAVRIRSDHVARVLDVGTLEGSHIPFIVMEYLQGRDLARELAARGSLPVDEVARHVLEACDAVGEAHSRGIVHRDLKPANLFLAERSGGVQMIKVLDFGISKTIGNGPKGLSITEPATLMGSPGYMSPEQLESSRNVDARTDIWSLGVILQEMVTGALPFDGDSVPQLIRAVISGNRPLLTEYGPALAVLEPVVARCLQQDRALRYQTIAELKEALLPLASRASARPSAASPSRVLDPISVPGAMSHVVQNRESTHHAAEGDGSSSGLPASGAVRGGAASSGAVKIGKTAGGATTGAHDRAGGTPDSAWGRTHGIGRAPLWRTLALAAAVGATAAFAFWRGRSALQSFGTPPGGEETAGLQVESAAPALEPLPDLAPPSPPPAAPSSEASAATSPGTAGTPPSEPAPASVPVVPPPTPKVAPIGSVSSPAAAARAGAPSPAMPPPSSPAPGPTAPSTSRPSSPTTAPAAKRVSEASSLDIGAALDGVAIGETAPPSDAPAAPSETPAAPPANAPAPGDGPPRAAVAPEDPPHPAPAAPVAPARNPYEIPEFGGRK